MSTEVGDAATLGYQTEDAQVLLIPVLLHLNVKSEHALIPIIEFQGRLTTSRTFLITGILKRLTFPTLRVNPSAHPGWTEGFTLVQWMGVFAQWHHF